MIYISTDPFQVVSNVCSYFGYTPAPRKINCPFTESLIAQLKMNKQGVFSTTSNFEKISGLDLPSVKDLILTRQGEDFILIGNESGGISDRFTWFIGSHKNFAFTSRLNPQREINTDIRHNSLLSSFGFFEELNEFVKDDISFPGKPFISADEIFTGAMRADVFYIVDGKILPAENFEKIPAKFNEFIQFCKEQKS